MCMLTLIITSCTVKTDVLSFIDEILFPEKSSSFMPSVGTVVGSQREIFLFFSQMINDFLAGCTFS